MLRKVVKHIASRSIKPLLSRYLRKTRRYTYNGIILDVAPEVFHPGFFFSTKLLLKYLLHLDIHGKKFLELGAGNGLIAFSAANAGAQVTASDINVIAIDYLKKNEKANDIHINIIHSDLFGSIPKQTFDIIAINPPYYKKDPQTIGQYAWYCGRNGDYFDRFFEDLSKYISHQSMVLMVLSEDCDINMIRNKATMFNFKLELAVEQKVLWEILYIFQIKQQY